MHVPADVKTIVPVKRDGNIIVRIPADFRIQFFELPRSVRQTLLTDYHALVLAGIEPDKQIPFFLNERELNGISRPDRRNILSGNDFPRRGIRRLNLNLT